MKLIAHEWLVHSRLKSRGIVRQAGATRPADPHQASGNGTQRLLLLRRGRITCISLQPRGWSVLRKRGCITLACDGDRRHLLRRLAASDLDREVFHLDNLHAPETERALVE